MDSLAEAELRQECRTLYRQGQHSQVRDLALARNTKAISDPALHLAWADLLEEIGLIEEVILELNLAIRDDPDRVGDISWRSSARCWWMPWCFP